MTATPKMSVAMLTCAGLFLIVGSLATLIPSFVDDRVVQQFIPVWTQILQTIACDSVGESTVRAWAVLSQWVIGVCEGAIGLILLAAAFLPKRRYNLANLGLSSGFVLFSLFMITLFALDDPNLPRWYMHLAIASWIGIIWLVVFVSERQSKW